MKRDIILDTLIRVGYLAIYVGFIILFFGLYSKSYLFMLEGEYIKSGVLLLLSGILNIGIICILYSLYVKYRQIKKDLEKERDSKLLKK